MGINWKMTTPIASTRADVAFTYVPREVEEKDSVVIGLIALYYLI
jgi:hypothetical protein